MIRRTEIVEETVETVTIRGNAKAVRAAAAAEAAKSQFSIPDDCFFAYYVAGEAWYANRIDVDRAEIMVSAAAHGGGCVWEFGVRVHDLGQHHPTAIRVEVFDDAFDAFTQARPFFDALAAEKPTTLGEVRAILDRLGARDTTPRVDQDGAGQ